MIDGYPKMTETDKLVLSVVCGVLLGYASILIFAFRHHFWILDAAGHPVMNDFVVFWTAGHLALKSAALAAYDAHRQYAAEIATVGHGFGGVMGWSYPPLFLFVAAALASLPYASAFLLWLSLTVALHACVVTAIAERRIAFIVAGAAPWMLSALAPGQNGFLTSAIIGLVLLHIEKRPAIAGTRSWPAQLQAAIRHSVSARARGRRILARLRLGRCRYAGVERFGGRRLRLWNLQRLPACADAHNGHTSH